MKWRIGQWTELSNPVCFCKLTKAGTVQWRELLKTNRTITHLNVVNHKESGVRTNETSSLDPDFC